MKQNVTFTITVMMSKQKFVAVCSKYAASMQQVCSSMQQANSWLSRHTQFPRISTKYVHSSIFRPIQPVIITLWDMLQYATGLQQQCYTMQLHKVLEISGHFLCFNMLSYVCSPNFSSFPPELVILLSMQHFAALMLQVCSSMQQQTICH